MVHPIKRLMPVTCSLLLAGGLVLAGCSPSSLVRYDQTRNLMGTFVTISLYAEDGQAAEAAFSAAFDRIRQVEYAASIFDPQAEAYRLNEQGYVNLPSQDLRKLVEDSIYYGSLTHGYFDITVQPLLEIWEAGLWREPAEVQKQRVDETMALTGLEKIMVEADRISFVQAGMQITLGGIAKGYAVGQALQALEEAGIGHALINAGGDIATSGPKPDGSPWLIELSNPDDTSQYITAFSLQGQSVATSGNYERYFDPEKQAHHLLNPLTGYSASECISVTIITTDPALADVLATAVFVMGPEQGLQFIEGLGQAEALIIDNDRQIHRSTGLGKYEKQAGQ